MAVFESVLVLLAAAVALSALARRLKAPLPTLLALAGAGLALSPVAAPFHLDPQLALALFLAPVLLDAGYDASPRDLKANWAPLAGLVFVAVGLTIAAVALIARRLEPSLTWPAAIALGAIVAPPDAAAATSVLRSVKLPHRITVVLEGESLLNDASALLVYRLALGAAATGQSFRAEVIAPAFLLSVVGALVAGPLAALAYLKLTGGLKDTPSAIVLQFVATFGVWIAAERLGLSPILTVVAYAMTVARFAPARTPARMRVPSYAVWETAVLVLNALAFVIIGLQLRPILAHAPQGELREWGLFAAAVLATVVAMRLVWVVAYTGGIRLKNTLWGARLKAGMAPPSWKGAMAVSWSGMRGLITVATALALPEGFPARELLLFTAFCVTLGTLVIQGLTLRPLLLALRLGDDGVVDAEVRSARVELATAALDALGDETGPEAEELRRELEEQRKAACEADEGDGDEVLALQALRGRMLRTRRARLLKLRDEEVIGEDAFHRLEEELDFAEIAAVSGA